jgi:hypothetical protein
MTDKKISELPLATSANDGDFVPIVASATTKKIEKSRLFLGDGDADAYDTIVGLAPIGYWTLNAAVPIKDEISQTNGVFNSTDRMGLFAPLGKNSITPTYNLVQNNAIDTGTNLGNLSEFSLSVFFFSTNSSLRYMGNSAASFLQGFVLYNNGPDIVRVGTGGGFIDIAIGAVVPLAQLCHFAWTFNNSTGHVFYLDGLQVATSASTTFATGSASNFLIFGAPDAPTTNRYSGTQKHVALFDKVLTPTEIIAIRDTVLEA